MKKDHVDLVIRQWKIERPDIDPSPMSIMGRLVRLGNIFSTQTQQVFTKYGLHSGEFDVLATLLRSGKPYALTPNRLFRALMLSSGAMTNRIDKLEAQKLVSRAPDANDRRGVIVSLTPKGLDLINKAITDHVNKGRELLSCLSPTEQETMAKLFKKLLIEHQGAISQLD